MGKGQEKREREIFQRSETKDGLNCGLRGRVIAQPRIYRVARLCERVQGNLLPSDLSACQIFTTANIVLKC